MATRICARCGERPTVTPRRKFCVECQPLQDAERRAKTQAAVEDWRRRNREHVNEQSRERSRKPCARCGGPKGEGERRRYCDACEPLAAEEKRRKAAERTARWTAENADRAKANRDAYAATDRGRARRMIAGIRHDHPNARIVEEVSPLTVYERDGGICGICKKPVDIERFQVDHIIELRDGGEHSYTNVQTAHKRCNLQKMQVECRKAHVNLRIRRAASLEGTNPLDAFGPLLCVICGTPIDPANHDQIDAGGGQARVAHRKCSGLG